MAPLKQQRQRKKAQKNKADLIGTLVFIPQTGINPTCY